MTKLVIEYLLLSELVPNTNNPKLHDLNAIRESYERFGYAEAIVRDDRTKKLASGHGRVEALSALRESGQPAPENILVKGDEWLVPVQTGWASKDDAEANAFLIAANRITEAGGWDNQATLRILNNLPDLAGTGWNKKELEQFASRLQPPAPANFTLVSPGNVVVHYKCPKCSHEWSGNPKP